MDIKDDPNRVGDPPEYYDSDDTRPVWCDLPEAEQSAIVSEFLKSQKDGEAILHEATLMMLEHIAEVISSRGLNDGWIIN
jgi:hypothetical protein